MRVSLSYRLVPFFVFLSSFSTAQLPSLAAVAPPATISGPPRNPTISAGTPLWQGVLQQQNVEEFSGPVAEVRREDVIPQGSALSPGQRTTVLKFDVEGHLIENTSQDSRVATAITTTTVFHNGMVQSRTATRHYGNGRLPDAQVGWQKWSFDTSGRLADLRAGSDNEENNHLLNFRYDVEGRLLGYEYRQNGSDKPFFFAEFKYEGKTITSDQFDENHRKIFEQVQVLDVSNHVVELSISDISDGALKLWYHTKFKYDERGRLTEQNTDQHNYAPGDVDSEPPPGRVAVLYDDKKHNGGQDFYDPGGKLVLRMMAEFDGHGYVTRMRVLDADGKPQDSNQDVWLDPKTHKTYSGTYTTDAIYDDHGNWTVLHSWFTPVDGSERILTRSIKQTITYR